MKTRSFTIMAAITAVIMFLFVILVSCTKGGDAPDPNHKGGDAPTLQVSGLKAFTITASSAVITGTVTNIDAKTSIFVRIQKAGGFPQSYQAKPETQGNFSVSVTGLDPATTYTINIVDGQSTVLSLPVSFVTLPASGVVVRPATKVTLTGATLNGKIVAHNDNTIVIFQYQKEGANSWLEQPVSSTYSGNDSVTVSIVLTSLEVETKYCYRLLLKNQAGEFTSAPEFFTTYAVTDYDGNMYHTVKIGNQVWLQENFRGTHFANGDPIPQIKATDTSWTNLTTPAMCYYNNDPQYGLLYGSLYNWYAASDARGLIKGWHLPALNEWDTLIEYYGGYMVAGGRMSPGGDFKGIYAPGFYLERGFGDGTSSQWWSATLAVSNEAFVLGGYKNKAWITTQASNNIAYGQSIRLIAD